ncbi:MAG: transcriptional regulator [Anaerolineales bacterium]
MAEDKPTNPAAELDPVIHAPSRLTIVTNLYVVESADFIFLRNLTGLTWGNLSAHLTKLEEAGYVEIKKTIVSKKTHSVAALTEEGRKAFEEYKEKMKEVLK